MKRFALYVIMGLVLIFIVFRLGAYTGVLQNFNVYSVENEPNLEEGDWVFGTNLLSPKRFDFISYKDKSDPNLKTHRIIGMPNDTLLIKDGITFINGLNVDKELNLKQIYIVGFQELELLKKQVEKLQYDKNRRISLDSLLIFLTDNEVERTFKPRMPLFKNANEEIKTTYNRSWSMDDFGPLIIPENKYFVMGDNRDVSNDSRFNGLVDKSQLTSTLLVN